MEDAGLSFKDAEHLDDDDTGFMMDENDEIDLMFDDDMDDNLI